MLYVPNYYIHSLRHYPHEMTTVHLVQSYYLPILSYGCEVWSEYELTCLRLAWCGTTASDTFSKVVGECDFLVMLVLMFVVLILLLLVLLPSVV